jgi:hypothetical protein
METEIFKTIEEFPNYMVSNFGNVKRSNSDSILKTKCKNDYNVINLYKQKQYTRFIHRLVAKTFIENPNNYDQVNHIDGNKSNNHTSNLEWCNYTQNKLHAINVLNAFKFLKNKPIARKLTIEQVIKIKQIFKTNTVTEDLIKSIASNHNVNPQTIKCIYWGKTWKDVE